MEKTDEMRNTADDFRPEAVVVAAGTFPTNPHALRWLDECDRIVCCDGAANELIARGYRPWRIVGDCDSLSPEIREKYEDIVRRIPDQETNDQTKAIRYLAERGYRRIVILGSTGKREDHTLGNISLLLEYKEHGLDVRAYTDYGVFIPAEGNSRFYAPVGTQVSIFNFGASDISGEGLRYPLYDFSKLWQGTLNETTSSSFSIRARGRYLLFINY